MTSFSDPNTNSAHRTLTRVINELCEILNEIIRMKALETLPCYAHTKHRTYHVHNMNVCVHVHCALCIRLRRQRATERMREWVRKNEWSTKFKGNKRQGNHWSVLFSGLCQCVFRALWLCRPMHINLCMYMYIFTCMDEQPSNVSIN